MTRLSAAERERRGANLYGYYMGPWRRLGHFYWAPGMECLPFLNPPPGCPWAKVDGHLTPRRNKEQGAAALTRRDGWTALAVHDYTVDDRPNSHSTFLFRATLDFDQAVLEAKRLFPEIVKRLGEKFTLVEVDGAA